MVIIVSRLTSFFFLEWGITPKYTQLGTFHLYLLLFTGDIPLNRRIYPVNWTYFVFMGIVSVIFCPTNIQETFNLISISLHYFLGNKKSDQTKPLPLRFDEYFRIKTSPLPPPK